MLALLILVSPVEGAAQAVVQDCPPDGYVDRTATSADREITWGFSIQSDPERCMRIRVGHRVTFIGSFGAHPLDPQGGDSPNPIATHADGRVTFTKAGTFGYVCGFHPQMKGAVHVVPTQVAAAVPANRPTAQILLAVGLLAIAALAQGRRRARCPRRARLRDDPSASSRQTPRRFSVTNQSRRKRSFDKVAST